MMTSFVVDTNVAIAANGRNTHADLECQLECTKKLENLCRQQVVVVDDSNLIFDEYKGYLNFAGVPGVGDMFFKHVFNHMHSSCHVRRISITPCSDDRLGFKELPENDLDKSDRKFLAAALVAQATILNATDSDWSEQEALTKSLGVTVQQLCPQHASKYSERG